MRRVLEAVAAGALVGLGSVFACRWRKRAPRPTDTERQLSYGYGDHAREIRVWLAVDGQSGVSIPRGMDWRQAAELLRETAKMVDHDWPGEPSET